MPIRPQDKHRYPDNWTELRESVLERAGHCCECKGECGSHQGIRCRAPNGALVTRERAAPWRWAKWTQWSTGEVEPLPTGHQRPITIVLTVAHLDRTPENDNLENLRAMCQRCHLRYDRFQHATNAARTRKSRKAAGWLPGLEE